VRPVIGVTSGWEPGHIVTGWPLVYTVKNVIERLEIAGAVPIVLPVVENEGLYDEMIGMLDGLVASGEVMSIHHNVVATGTTDILQKSNPLRYRNERAAIQAALRHHLPILAICRGYQVLNELEGGTLTDYDITDGDNACLHQQGGDVAPDTPVHGISIRTGTMLYEMLAEEHMQVNSFHRQAVIQPPPGYTASAISEDGWIEAIEAADDRWIVGLQFHPEMLSDTLWHRVFSRFIERAGRSTGET
jgi:putative glutamine amidotransferase